MEIILDIIITNIGKFCKKFCNIFDSVFHFLKAVDKKRGKIYNKKGIFEKKKDRKSKMPEKLKKFAPSIIMPVIFETVAVVLTVTPDNISYLFILPVSACLL